MKRDLMSLHDLSGDEIIEILDLTDKVKKDKSLYNDLLNGKNVGLVFQKPSNRTRVSFEVGISQLGGNCVYLGPDEINLGVRESTSDVSKTLSRYLDLIIARTNKHADIVELAKNATIPVINGLSDMFHPCQALADIFSIQEKFKKVRDISIAYVGDGNNVCHSLLLACAKLGAHVSVATPHGYEPDKDVINDAIQMAHAHPSRVSISNSPPEAIKGADVIYSDVWVSMGQEEEAKRRLEQFRDFQVNAELASLANDKYVFMHCLPAHRGQEVTADVIDGKHSIVFDQAENRLHTQKGIIVFLLKQDMHSRN